MIMMKMRFVWIISFFFSILSMFRNIWMSFMFIVNKVFSRIMWGLGLVCGLLG